MALVALRRPGAVCTGRRLPLVGLWINAGHAHWHRLMARSAYLSLAREEALPSIHLADCEPAARIWVRSVRWLHRATLVRVVEIGLCWYLKMPNSIAIMMACTYASAAHCAHTDDAAPGAETLVETRYLGAGSGEDILWFIPAVHQWTNRPSHCERAIKGSLTA